MADDILKLGEFNPSSPHRIRASSESICYTRPLILARLSGHSPKTCGLYSVGAKQATGESVDAADPRKVNRERQRFSDSGEESERKHEAVSRFARGVVHELNNLLVGIFGYAELGLADISETSPTYQHLRDIMSSARRVESFCHSLKKVAGRDVKPNTLHCLNDIVERAASESLRGIPEWITVNRDIARSTLHIKADESFLDAAIQAVMLNAVEACHGRTAKISIRTSLSSTGHPTDGHRFLTGDPNGEGAVGVIEIIDTGVGMKLETLQRMFDPFFTEKPNRSGLGLAALLGVVEAHGGAVLVDSAEAAGTTVCISFPLAQEAPRTSGASNAPVEWKGGSVLFIDGDASVCSVAERMLQRSGVRAFTARGRDEALAILEKHESDLRCAYLDLSLSGAADRLFFQIRRAAPKLPIVLIMDETCRDQVDALIHAGAKCSITKPFDTASLVEPLSILHRNDNHPEADDLIV